MISLCIPLTLPTLSSFSAEPNSRSRRKNDFLQRKWSGCAMKCCSIVRRSFVDVGFEKDGILIRRGRKERVFVVRSNQGGSGFNGGGGGGGGDKGSTTRVLGNLALAIGITYLSMTGQLGWILDTIVSIWLLAVIVPIVGLGVLFWYAGRDIVQSSCPSCGNDFQILKSSLKDSVQVCPFCTQPFSVQGNKFVREPTEFSSGRSTTPGQASNDFSRRSEKGKASSTAIVDIEAEVKDIE